MIYANNTHFHKKSSALGLILKVRVFGTRKWPITAFFVRVDTHADVHQVESLIRVFRYAKALNHGRTKCRLLERSKKSRPGWLACVWHAACASTLLWTAYNYKVFYAFLFFTEWSTRCPAQIQSGSLVGYWIQRNAFLHKMCLKMCISVIPCFSLNWWCGWGDV